jgi:peptide/nickel transport system permease protein
VKYVLRRLVFYLIALWAAVTIDFFLPRLLPGDPAAVIIGTKGTASMTGEQVASLRAALGLSDAPLGQQYLIFLGHLFRGDLGISFSHFPAPVTEVIATGFRWTLLLGSVSLLFSVIIGHLIGIYGAWRRGGFFDRVMPPLFNFIGAFPAFFLALITLYVLGLHFKWFPIAHSYDTLLKPGFSWEYIASVTKHLFMPALVGVLVNLQVWIQNMRNSMIGVLAEDYVTMAEAKGLTQNNIMFGYVARNAILPSVTGFGVFLGAILGGQVLIEQVFSYPGLGFMLVHSVGQRDYPLMQGLFLGITVGVLLLNFLVDILYTRIDPRVRTA